MRIGPYDVPGHCCRAHSAAVTARSSDMTGPEAKSIVSVLVAAFPRLSITQATLNVYVSELLDLDAAETAAAVHRLIRTNSYLPTVADVRREVARGQTDGIEAGDAWAMTRRAIQRYGYYREREGQESLPPAVWRAVQGVGGWQYLCHSESEMADRAHFLRHYGEGRDAAQRERQLGSASQLRLVEAQQTTEAAGLIEGLAKAVKR